MLSGCCWSYRKLYTRVQELGICIHWEKFQYRYRIWEPDSHERRIPPKASRFIEPMGLPAFSDATDDQRSQQGPVLTDPFLRPLPGQPCLIRTADPFFFFFFFSRPFLWQTNHPELPSHAIPTLWAPGGHSEKEIGTAKITGPLTKGWACQPDNMGGRITSSKKKMGILNSCTDFAIVVTWSPSTILGIKVEKRGTEDTHFTHL